MCVCVCHTLFAKVLSRLVCSPIAGGTGGSSKSGANKDVCWMPVIQDDTGADHSTYLQCMILYGNGPSRELQRSDVKKSSYSFHEVYTCVCV